MELLVMRRSELTQCNLADVDEEDSARSRIRDLTVSAAVKFADLLDGKIERSRLDDQIQSLLSPRSATIDEG
jgi:hypothetical protein